MNPEIHVIIEDMKRRKKSNPMGDLDIQNYLSVETSRLLVLLAEEAEKSAEKNVKISNRILFLTWVIVALTAVLVFTVFFEVPKVSIKLDQQAKFSTKQTQENNSDKQLNKVNLNEVQHK